MRLETKVGNSSSNKKKTYFTSRGSEFAILADISENSFENRTRREFWEQARNNPMGQTRRKLLQEHQYQCSNEEVE